MNFLLLGLYSVGVVGAALIGRRLTNLVAQVILNLACSLSLFTILLIIYAAMDFSTSLPPLPQHFRWYVVFGILSLVAITLIVRVIPKPEKTKKKNQNKNLAICD